MDPRFMTTWYHESGDPRLLAPAHHHHHPPPPTTLFAAPTTPSSYPRRPPHCHLTSMDFPKFNGKSDPLAFINQCESYFNRERIMEEEKVWMAACNLEDDARVWFLQVQQDEGTPAWRRFTKLLPLRFGSPPSCNLLHNVSTMLDRLASELLQLSDQIERSDRRRRAAVRLQAAARGLLARRWAQSLREEKCLAVCPSTEEQAAVRLQAAGRGFLARRVARKMRMLLGSSLSYVFIHSASPIHPVAPIEVEVRVWGLSMQRTRNAVQQQASMAMAVSFVMAPALVLDKPKARVGWYTLHPSAHMKPADALFPWDPGETSITCRSKLP
ncbi:hypothetical protein PVAP13_6NG239806 [Panicum virgatum]|uniref:Retrotransposon gag domain-containing protein n=1 Tax=Panicum virgatum TaxID=38727 RepID=A0A8T0R0V4_PANVG|nr:hypothetical protein PVAP13_6NG239806 [Panicum virgatum]